MDCLSSSETETPILETIASSSFRELIITHRVTSQIRAYLRSKDSIDQSIEDLYKFNKLSQLQLLGTLQEIGDEFDSKSIQFCVLKGAALSQIVYGDASERTSRDIDLLIQIKDLDASVSLLENLGYHLLTKYHTPKQKQALVKHYHHFEFEHEQSGTIIELHWYLNSSRSYQFDMNVIWLEMTTTQIGDRNYTVLSLYNRISFLSVHGVLHSYSRLQWLVDIQQILISLNKEQLQEMLKHAKDQKAGLYLNVTIGVLEQVLHFKLDESIRSSIQFNRRENKLIQKCIQEIKANTSEDQIPKNRYQYMMHNHQMQFLTEGIKGFFKSVNSRNVRPKNWEFYAFPDSVFFLNNVLSRPIWAASKVFGKRK